MFMEELCMNLHNFFVRAVVPDTFTITEGTVSGLDFPDGVYIRIIGSMYNDGVYKVGESPLKDETFTGQIWLMVVPAAVEALANEIEAWIAKNPATDKTSESFGGYSYTKGNGTGGWQDAFASRLNAWRKL